MRKSMYQSLATASFVRFAVVGGCCAVANLLFIWFATEYGGLHYLASIAVAFMTINAGGYLLNKYFTFGRAGTSMWREVGMYYRVMFTSMLLGLFAMFVLVDLLGFNYLIAAVLLTAVLTLRNFIMHRDRTFK
jgi:putative flippase GtrA